MARGTIIRVKKGHTGNIRGEDGKEYRFNRKGVVDGGLDRIQRGRVVEFEPDGDWAVNVRLLDDMEIVSKSPPKPSPEKPKANTTEPKKDSLVGSSRFLNPYNFVRLLSKPRLDNHVLGNCPPPPHDRYVGLTGRITCEVKAVTPLFISDSHAVDGRIGEHRTYRFFQVDKQPAIPASSLRGMVRSVFETVTNSCYVAFDRDPLSFHFPSRRAPWLVPARVERNGDEWQLRLLTGTTHLQIESHARKSPQGKQYAAWSASYWPIKPSKTLRGIEPKRFKLGQKQLDSRRSFIARTRSLTRNPDGVKHGEQCYALLRPFQHPHPKIRFWDVVEIRRKRSDLPNPKRGERIEQGWLCVTNQNIEPKHSERFFFRAQENSVGPESIPLPRKARDAYEALIRDYQKRHQSTVQKRKQKKQPLGKPVGDTPGLSRFVYQHEERELQGGELVYCLLEGTTGHPRVKFIVPVSVPRVGYEHSVGDLLPDFLLPCDDIDVLCPACRVFGWVREGAQDIGQQKSVAYAGRVRFSHGTLKHSAGTLPDITLAILSTPKTTTTTFYLLDAQGQPSATIDYDSPNASLRGRKVYRHHGEQASEQEYKRAGGKKDDQNRSVQGALKPGTTFAFVVDFENLHPLELGALLYAIQLEDGMFHRLGYAKPLGFGSVKITVEQVQLIDWSTRLGSLTIDAGWVNVPSDKMQEYKKAFLSTMRRLYGDEFESIVLSDLRALLGEPPNLPIHYPRTGETPDPEGKNFEWFVGNKRRESHGVTLPIAPRDTEGLPLMNKKGEIRT